MATLAFIDPNILYHPVRTDVGEVEKQRWNGCPTGDGRVEGSFVETC